MRAATLADGLAFVVIVQHVTAITSADLVVDAFAVLATARAYWSARSINVLLPAVFASAHFRREAVSIHRTGPPAYRLADSVLRPPVGVASAYATGRADPTGTATLAADLAPTGYRTSAVAVAAVEHCNPATAARVVTSLK